MNKPKHPTVSFILTTMSITGKLKMYLESGRFWTILFHMMTCHTGVCGYTKETCKKCGHVHYNYGSCNDSFCPQCGARKRKEWAEKQKAKKVQAPYYHIIFTVPDSALNPLFLSDKKFMYSALMKASAETLKKFCADPKYLGVKTPGFTSVLHTWSSTLGLHCHVHVLLCAAGLDHQGKFICGKSQYLFPSKAVASVFKGKLLGMIGKKYSYTGSPWLSNLMKASTGDWNVEIRACKGNPDHVIEYTSRYINRTAISNGRLVAYENGMVTFRYKDYRNKGKLRTMKLADSEFVRRLSLHVLPSRFLRCRHYGFLGNNSAKLLKKVQELSIEYQKSYGNHETLPAATEQPAEKSSKEELKEFEPRKCPKCGGTEFTKITVPRPFDPLSIEFEVGIMINNFIGLNEHT